jgi:hypothetical protein
MKYAVKMTPGGRTYMSSSMKICIGVRKPLGQMSIQAHSEVI